MAEPENVPDSAKEAAPLQVSAVLAVLGVVYGDIATSPLYAIRECFHGDFAIDVDRDGILGILSLMFWSLTIIVSIKYLLFVLRADNRGEGGVIALTALVQHPRDGRRRSARTLVVLGIFGAALLYGDGMITPAISVLSAVEGLHVVTPAFDDLVVPITIVILLALFALQRHGTRRVGTLFGPVIALWLVVLALLGIPAIAREPQVLEALDPLHGVRFIAGHGASGFLALGAVFLVVTGAEALYADLGHFGPRPIRAGWFGLALPCLCCNYFGQGALLLAHPEHADHPFFSLVPEWAGVPMLVLATLATIIASQAVISGAFSLTRQAIQLGFLPRMRTVHTSQEQIGQIYVPLVNRLLAVATIALVVGFGSSSRLAAAYGVAVTTTMLITTVLLAVVARRRWGWSMLRVAPLVAIFATVDCAFFLANLGKIAHGAWFPLLIGAVFLLVMLTWRRGREIKIALRLLDAVHVEQFQKMLRESPPRRIEGHAVYLTSDPNWAPMPLRTNVARHGALHAQVTLLGVRNEEVPTVSRDEKVEVHDLGDGMHQVVARYGFTESPNVPHVLALAREKGLPVEVDDVVFFVGRETILAARRPGMARWRVALFAFMERNAELAANYFGLPSAQVVEIGAQVPI